jgi:hypothetical protein
MNSPIDRIRRAVRLRAAGRAERPAKEAARIDAVHELDPAAPVQPPLDPASAAAFEAHMLGQHGEKRGLRAGAPALNAAKTNYNRTEWSGRKDRRARKGRIADTEV